MGTLARNGLFANFSKTELYVDKHCQKAGNFVEKNDVIIDVKMLSVKIFTIESRF